MSFPDFSKTSRMYDFFFAAGLTLLAFINWVFEGALDDCPASGCIDGDFSRPFLFYVFLAITIAVGIDWVRSWGKGATTESGSEDVDEQKELGEKVIEGESDET